MTYKRKFVGQKDSPRKVREVYGLDVDSFACREIETRANDERSAMLRMAWDFLWERERQVLTMIADGKGPSDVAAVFGLNSRQHACKEMERARVAARFYCEHAGVIVNLVKLGPVGEGVLTRTEVRLAQALVIERRTFEDVGQMFGRSRHWVKQSVPAMVEKLMAAGKVKTAEMLMRFAAMKQLRSRRRRIMSGDAWRDEFKVMVDMLIRKGVFYVWGGQDPFKRPFGEADCSGLTIEVLKKLGKLPERFPDTTAKGLSREFNETKKPKPGDLAFYGRNWRSVSHVAFHLGRVEGDGFAYEDAVASMSGGRRGMTLEHARLVGAGLWVRSSAMYRRDYLGSKRVP